MAGRAPRLLRFLHTGEELFAACALGAMALLPLAEIVIRPFIAGGSRDRFRSLST